MVQALLGAASLGMGVAGMLRKPQQVGYSKGDMDYLAAQRMREIDSFNADLANLRTRYSSQLAKFGDNTFARFAPQAEAMFASRGLNPMGGAYQSALARKTAEIQDAGMLKMLDLENSDLRAVDAARGNVRSAQLGGGFGNYGERPDNLGQLLAAGSFALGEAAQGMGSGKQTPFSAPKNAPAGWQGTPQKRSVFSRFVGR